MKKSPYILLPLGLVALAGVAIVVWLLTARVTLGEEQYPQQRVYIPTGSTYEALCDSLDAHCIMSPSMAFPMMARLRGLPDHVKGGSYLIDDGMSVLQLVNKLNSGSQDPIRLTINKHRTVEHLCQFLGEKMEFSADSMLLLLSDTEVCAQYGETPQTILGLFLRNTYEVYWTASPRRLLDRMKRESDAFWQPREKALQTLGLTRQQVVTLASIVEEETNVSDEKADIASVYLNRLRIGMPLQADPTVKYAMGDFSIQRILNFMLLIDSPYNTYRIQGLPPGPICIPSATSIDAVLKNKKTSWIYFCAKEDFSGRHNFATNLSEHKRNADRFHNALNKRKIR